MFSLESYECYSSGDIPDPIAQGGVNIQAYLGQDAKIGSSHYLPLTEYRVDPDNNPLEIELPIE